MSTITMNKVEINIAKDFTEFPWARFKTDWEFSWQEFYEKFLMDINIDCVDEIEIILDGTYWYPSSFLSEAFNCFYQKYKEKWWLKLKFVSREDPSLIDFINHLVKKNAR